MIYNYWIKHNNCFDESRHLIPMFIGPPCINLILPHVGVAGVKLFKTFLVFFPHIITSIYTFKINNNNY